MRTLKKLKLAASQKWFFYGKAIKIILGFVLLSAMWWYLYIDMVEGNITTQDILQNEFAIFALWSLALIVFNKLT